MKLFYFTGTGNSLYIAKQLGGDLYSIPQVLKGDTLTFEDEKIGIICPTYGLSIPNMVKEFIQKVTLKTPYLFFILTCSNITADATKWITTYAKKYGLTVHYSNFIKMPGNHIPIADIEQEKLLDKEIDTHLNQLIDDINKNKQYINKGMILGSALRHTINLVHNIHPIDSPKNFSVTDDCIKCSTCIKVCPRANITFNESKQIIFHNHCETCLACVHNCPKTAIQVKRDKNPQARYRHENISLKEIITSNQQ